jgi:hypothetical protein
MALLDPTIVLMCINTCEVHMNKILIAISVIDQVIRIAELLKAGAVAIKKRNELSDHKQESEQDS